MGKITLNTINKDIATLISTRNTMGYSDSDDRQTAKEFCNQVQAECASVANYVINLVREHALLLGFKELAEQHPTSSVVLFKIKSRDPRFRELEVSVNFRRLNDNKSYALVLTGHGTYTTEYNLQEIAKYTYVNWANQVSLFDKYKFYADQILEKLSALITAKLHEVRESIPTKAAIKNTEQLASELSTLRKKEKDFAYMKKIDAARRFCVSVLKEWNSTVKSLTKTVVNDIVTGSEYKPGPDEAVCIYEDIEGAKLYLQRQADNPHTHRLYWEPANIAERLPQLFEITIPELACIADPEKLQNAELSAVRWVELCELANNTKLYTKKLVYLVNSCITAKIDEQQRALAALGALKREV